MSPSEADDIWDAVNKLRDSVSDLGAIIREVKAMLAERCDARSARIEVVEKKQERQEARLEALEKKGAYQAGRAAVIGAIVSGSLTLCAGLVLHWMK
jgi:GTPase